MEQVCEAVEQVLLTHNYYLPNIDCVTLRIVYCCVPYAMMTVTFHHQVISANGNIRWFNQSISSASVWVSG